MSFEHIRKFDYIFILYDKLVTLDDADDGGRAGERGKKEGRGARTLRLWDLWQRLARSGSLTIVRGVVVVGVCQRY